MSALLGRRLTSLKQGDKEDYLLINTLTRYPKEARC